MNNNKNLDIIIKKIQSQINNKNFRLTQHAQQEMVEENYAEHERGACCLINGITYLNRSIHIVCTTNQNVLIIITVYEPKLPKWITPIKRRDKK
jgi:hypothetical protein